MTPLLSPPVRTVRCTAVLWKSRMLYPFKSGAAQRFCLAFDLSPIRRQTTSLEQLLSLQRALCLALLFNRLPFPPLVFTSFFGTMVWADFWMGCTTKELLQRHNCNSSFSAPGILRYQKATSRPCGQESGAITTRKLNPLSSRRPGRNQPAQSQSDVPWRILVQRSHSPM